MSSKFFLSIGIALVVFFGALSAFTSDHDSSLNTKPSHVKEFAMKIQKPDQVS